MERISSRQHALVKRFRAAAQKPGNDLLLDGAHLLGEALASGMAVELVAIRDGAGHTPVHALAREAELRGARVLGVSEKVLDAISPVRSPSGIVAIAQRRQVSLETALQRAPQLVLVVNDVQDPGNVGAIARAAEACGATGVITTGATADPFGWKALRGSMGSAFRIPIAANQPLDRVLEAARARRLRVLAAVPQSGVLLPRCDLRQPCVVLLGGEGAGLGAEIVNQADERLTIPMRPPVDSLNVATAAALIAYEAMRQREGADA